MDSKTYMDKWILSVSDVDDIMGSSNVFLREQVRLSSTKKESLQLPKFSEVINTHLIVLQPKSKNKVVDQSMVPLIRGPFAFLYHDHLSNGESNDDDNHESYLREYLSKKVRRSINIKC